MRVMEIIRDAEGGMKAHFLDLVKGLSVHGVEVIALCNFETKSKKVMEEAGAQVISFSFPGTIRPFADCISIVKIVSIIRRTKPDIVHCHGFKAGLLGRLASLIANVPMFYTVHNFVTYGRGKYASWMIRCIESWMSKKTDRIVCVSKALKKNMVEEMGIDGNKIKVIYNSIADWPPGDRKATREKYYFNESHILIGTVARLILSKGMEILLQAASGILIANPHIRLLIVGSGPQESRLKGLAQALGIEAQAVFAGRVSDIQNYYSAFDIFVLPTLTEGLGITVLEAMSFGLPVIATSVGGIPELIEHERNGILVAADNVFELRIALQYLIDNPSKAKKYGNHAREDIEESLDQNKMVDETISVLKNIYNRRLTLIGGIKYENSKD